MRLLPYQHGAVGHAEDVVVEVTYEHTFVYLSKEAQAVYAHPVMAACNQVLLTVQGMDEVRMILPGKVAQDVYMITATYRIIPIGDELAIHLVNVGEWSVRMPYDVGMIKSDNLR